MNADGLGIDRFGLLEGLPGLSVTDLTVSTDGRLWLIASGVLVSFDGLEFERHPLPEDTPGALTGISWGRGDTLWATVRDRVVSKVGERVALRARHDRIVRGVWQNGDTLWAWDSDGILRVSEGRTQRVRDVLFGGPPIVMKDTGRESTLFLRVPDGGPSRPYRTEAPEALHPDRWSMAGLAVASLVRTTEADGLVRVSPLGPGSAYIVPGPQYGDPLLRDRRGRLWLSAGERVSAWTPSGRRIAAFDLPGGGRVLSVLEDPEGNVWFGTLTGGIFRVREHAVRVYAGTEGLPDGQVRKVAAADPDGVVAIDDGGVLLRYSPRGVDTLYAPDGAEDIARATTVDRAGTVWYVAGPAGAVVLFGRAPDGSERRIPLGDRWATAMQEDPDQDGLIWFAGRSVFRVDTQLDRPEAERVILDAPLQGRHLHVEGGGRAMAIGEGGLVRVGPEGAEFVVDADGSRVTGRAVHRTADGTLWLGSYDRGLRVLRGGAIHEIRATDGLWDDGTSSIVEDEEGILWMGSNRGIHKVDPGDVYAFLDGRADDVGGRGYGPEAGFLNAETSGWPAARTADGRLWFPTFGGVAVIDPAERRAVETRPPGVRITGVHAGDATFPVDSLVQLPDGLRRLDVAWGAIQLGGQSDVRYAVRLAGVDEDWVDLGSQRQVSYGALPPGRHRFSVRASSGVGGTGVNEAGFTVSVPPRFTETRAFALLMVLMAAASAGAIAELRVRTLHRREVALRGLVDERTSELTTALEIVEDQASRLRSLDEAKSRFFANVSHELRTPLTLVQGPLQDVLDGRLGPTPDPVRKQVATVLASGRRLGELVEQLLDVARLEAGSFRLHRRSVDLCPLIERLADAFEALAVSQGLHWRSDVPAGPVRGYVDIDCFEKVVTNLLSNACKFTPEGGLVTLDAHGIDLGETGSGLVVVVSDSGPGIPEEERERIFERFHQVDDSERRAFGGAGLGLSLVREIVELHGGTVTVDSEVGVGSTFTVRLPLSEAPEALGSGTETRARRAGRPTEAVRGEARNLPEPVDGAAGTPDLDDPPTVLVIEDNDELREYLRTHLEDQYRVVEARDGREGLDAARSEPPDLILSDVMMPRMDGETLCREVRRDPELSFLPVVLVTARASRPSRISALEGGADDYLVKPFDPEELRLRIRNLLAARRRLAERLAERGETLPVPASAPARGDGHDDFRARLAQVLRAHVGDETFGVDDLARALFTSRSSLYTTMADALDATPMEVVWGYRLDQAALLLRETDATVSEVAYACGFKTVPHFTRRFKDRHEKTPAAYRRDSSG